jgi:hypothetical protein
MATVNTSNDNTYRTQVQWASGLNLLAAIWLFISAFAVYAHGSMMTNNVILGIVIGVLAAIRLAGAYDQAWVSWLNALLGVWVVVSPWAVMGTGPFGPTQAMIINNCITGGVIIALSCWSAIATNAAPTSLTTYPGETRPEYGR